MNGKSIKKMKILLMSSVEMSEKFKYGKKISNTIQILLITHYSKIVLIDFSHSIRDKHGKMSASASTVENIFMEVFSQRIPKLKINSSLSCYGSRIHVCFLGSAHHTGRFILGNHRITFPFHKVAVGRSN